MIVLVIVIVIVIKVMIVAVQDSLSYTTQCMFIGGVLHFFSDQKLLHVYVFTLTYNFLFLSFIFLIFFLSRLLTTYNNLKYSSVFS